MTGKPPVGPAALDERAFAEAHRQLLADGSIQFDLPRFEPPEMPAWLNSLGNFMSGDHPILRLLMWLVVGAIALLLLYAIGRWLSGAGWPWRRKAAEAADESWRPEEAPARRLLSEADALAAQGRYSEAAHLLLFRSIDDIDARRPELVGPALTSRDIAALPAIPTGPRGAFARIAALVERSLFARRDLVADDWRDCRAAYEEFAFADGWRG